MTPFNLFIVEDSESYRFLLTKFFRQRSESGFPKFNLYSFSSIDECIKACKHTRPDFVLLDYCLDGNIDQTHYNETITNGYDLMVWLKEKFSDLKVIFLSEQNNIHITAEIFHAGADGYIPKNPLGRINAYNYILKLISKLNSPLSPSTPYRSSALMKV